MNKENLQKQIEEMKTKLADMEAELKNTNIKGINSGKWNTKLDNYIIDN